MPSSDSKVLSLSSENIENQEVVNRTRQRKKSRCSDQDLTTRSVLPSSPSSHPPRTKKAKVDSASTKLKAIATSLFSSFYSTKKKAPPADNSKTQELTTGTTTATDIASSISASMEDNLLIQYSS